MKPMSIEELSFYWRDKADEIASDESLDYKEKHYLFRDAYETFLFYREAVNKHEDEARDEAIRLGFEV